MHITISRRLATATLLIAATVVACEASAQDVDGGTPQDAAGDTEESAAPASVAAPSADTTQPAAAAAEDEAMRTMREVARFAKFDELRPQGQTSDLPGVYDNITADTGGYRTWLYERGLYWRGASVNAVIYDVAGGGGPNRPQRYSGQNFTALQSNDFRLSWKIGGSAEDITQINLGLFTTVTNWRQTGPTIARISNLNFYTSFLDRTIELKAGVNGNISDYIGIFAGGNPILASGLGSTVPLSTGMSGGSGQTPTASIQFNGRKGFYARSGIQRSMVPGGMIEEAAGAGLGLKLNRDGARAMFIQEFGVRRASSPEGPQIWLRAGGTYNLTRYNRLDGQGRDRNWMVYALADYQFYQPDKRASYRGVYAGFSALFAPDAINAYKSTLEARVYALGMIPGRPSDQVTMTVGLNGFSRSGGRALAATGVETNRNQFSVGALYAYHAARGVYVSPSITYIRNPSFVGDFKPALNLSTSLTLMF